ncbi:SPFH domain-containing protein [soil metagenome]
MAEITRPALVWRHLRANPTVHVRHLRKGTLVHDGVGQAFWFRPRTAAISEVPLEDRAQPMLFHARTADFQDVAVQATVTYRVVDPALAATRIDFGIDPGTGAWISTPLETMGELLTELAQQPAVDVVAALSLEQALTSGIAAVRVAVAAALADDVRLAERGLAVADVRVVAISAERELQRALETPARERVQVEADRATYERRATAVQRERAIAENELSNEIELARRHEELVAQRGQNERRRATEQAAADRIAAESAAATGQLAVDAEADQARVRAAATADADRTHGAAQAEVTRTVGEAEAASEAARLAAYDGLESTLVLALAIKELAGQLPDIGTLHVTPDVLGDLVGHLTGARA